MILRSKNTYKKFIYDFIKNILVVCPKCSNKAVVKTNDFSFKNYQEKNIRLICSNCGYNKLLTENPNVVVYSSNKKIIQGQHFYIGGSIDPFFHVPLWLSEKFGNNLLWAYNYEHLEFIRQHIESKLRERNGQEHINRSLGSRLPKWMSSKKNREKLLKIIDKLNNS